MWVRNFFDYTTCTSRSFTDSNGGGAVGRVSTSWMTCQPYCVCTGVRVYVFGASCFTASANGGTIRSGLGGSGGLVEGRDGNLVATDLRRAFNHSR